MSRGQDLATYIEVASRIAEEVDDTWQRVPWSFLRRGIPSEDRDTQRGRDRLRVVLDLFGVLSTEGLAELRACATSTGPLDLALRLRHAFTKNLFGQEERIDSALLAKVAAVCGGGRKAIDGLVEALEAAGFRSFCARKVSYGREHPVLPDGTVKLKLVAERGSLTLADSQHHAGIPGPKGDDVLRAHFPQFSTYTCEAQRDAIRAILDPNGPRSIIARLPTGAGKSLIFLLPCATWRARGEPSTAIVVSPVIALQNDMVQKIKCRYRAAGLAAREINSTVDRLERTETYRLLRQGKLDLLFLSPERVAEPFFREILAEAANAVRMLVIDEAHMVDEWGQDFRPDFFRLGQERRRLLELAPDLRTVFLSATLSEDSEATLRHVFQLENAPVSLCDPTLRRELSLRVVHCGRNDDRKPEILLELLKQVPRPCIVYCSMTDHVRDLKRRLKSWGFRRTTEYMGPTAAEYRQQRLQWFHDGDVDVVLATNAFGLGVDKADVRTVIHYDVPECLDAYYQEMGRSGRDGYTSHGLLLYSSSSMGQASRRRRAILTAEKAAERAELMLRHREDLPADGPGACLLPIHVAPARLEGDSDLNQKWNFAVLNILEQVGNLKIDGVASRLVRVSRGPNVRAMERLGSAGWLASFLKKERETAIDLLKVARKLRHPLAELASTIVRLTLARAIELGTDEGDTETWVLVTRTADVTWSRRHAQALEAFREKQMVRANREVDELHRFLKGKGCRLQAFASVYRVAVPPPCGHCDNCDTRLRTSGSALLENSAT